MRTPPDDLGASPGTSERAALEVEAAEGTALGVFPLRRFRRFSEIEHYVARVVTSGWWSERFPDAPLEVALERRSRSATFSAAAIHTDAPVDSATATACLPPPGRAGEVAAAAARTDASELAEAGVPDGMGIIWLVDGRGWGLETVLHELAHLAAGPGAGHGEGFRSALGELWRHEAGIEPWAALQRAFRGQQPG